MSVVLINCIDMKRISLLIVFLYMVFCFSCSSKKGKLSINEIKSKIEKTEVVKDKKILGCFNIFSDTASLKTVIIHKDTLAVKGEKSICFITKTIPVSKEYDHALLTSLIGVAVYDFADNEVKQDYFTKSGNFGADPVYEVVKTQEGHCYICFFNGTTMMGITEVDIDVYAFTGDTFKKVLSLEQAEYDNSGYVGNDSTLLKSRKVNIEKSDYGIEVETISRYYDDNLGGFNKKSQSKFYSFSEKNFVLEEIQK